MSSARTGPVSVTAAPAGKATRGSTASFLVAGLVSLYIGLLVLPIAAAYLQGLPPRQWLDELSSAFALSAFSGLLIEFVLSGRFRFVSSHIGIDTTMRFHQLMARSLTVMALIHPVLYVSMPGSYPMPQDTTRQFAVNLNLATTVTGLVAWVALAVLVLFAIFRQQSAGSYEAWRLGHGVAAAIVAVFGTLHTLESGRYSQDPWLTGFWLVMLALALLTLVWVYWLKPALQLRYPYEVRSVSKIAERTWELIVEPKHGEAIDFCAGQFVWLSVGHSAFSLNENPFSIASAPARRDHLAFVIKEVGDFTRGIGQIRPGTRAYVDGPHGNMTIEDRPSSGIAFYAGGVGVAPILAMLRQLRHEADERPILLLYGNRRAEQIVYRKELDAMRRDLNLQVEYFLYEPPPGWFGRQGMIDSEAIVHSLASRSPADWVHVICGPLPMIEGIETTLLSIGVPGRQIISERFYYD